MSLVSPPSSNGWTIPLKLSVYHTQCVSVDGSEGGGWAGRVAFYVWDWIIIQSNVNIEIFSVSNPHWLQLVSGFGSTFLPQCISRSGSDPGRQTNADPDLQKVGVCHEQYFLCQCVIKQYYVCTKAILKGWNSGLLVNSGQFPFSRSRIRIPMRIRIQIQESKINRRSMRIQIRNTWNMKYKDDVY